MIYSRKCFNKAKATIALLLMLFCLNYAFAQNKRALLIGISKYENSGTPESKWSDIHGCNDIEIIKQPLQRQKFQIKCLVGRNATAQAIRQNFERLIKNTEAGDVIFIHLSGHGQAVEDDNRDEEDGWDESFVSYNAQKVYNAKVYQGQNHIIDDELNGYLVKLRKKTGPTGIVYVVIDACHAGSSYRSEDDSVCVRGTAVGFSKSGKKYEPKIDKRDMIKLYDSKELSTIYIVEACRSYEVNTEIIEGGKYYGPLSYYTSKVLSTTNIAKDGQWIDLVRKLMDGDMRLVRQHLVIETSK